MAGDLAIVNSNGTICKQPGIHPRSTLHPRGYMLIILLDVEFRQCSIELMWDEYRQVDVTSLVDMLARTNVIPWYVIWVGIVYE